VGFKGAHVDLAKIRKKARRNPNGPEASKDDVRTPAEGAAPSPSDSETTPPPAPGPAGPEEVPVLPLPAPAPVPAPPPEEGGEFPARSGSGRGEELLVFVLHREKYAIPIHDITLIIDERDITPIPNAPPFLKGILTLRGKIVNVLDVAARLGIRRPSAPEGRKIVILDMGADHFGLLVDGIEQLVEVDVQSLEPPPDGFRPVIQEYVEGVFHHGGRAVAFLNLPLFLTFEF